ncbi:signal recognition particle-docking protein FtsY [bacterium]|nr:signal recognition particle-docking protein FtsY [candidate division CSSED10-310 bacterium]
MKDDKFADQVHLSEIYREEGHALVAQNKIVRAIESYIRVFDIPDLTLDMHQETLNIVRKLKRELESAEGLKKYRIDPTDRKYLSNLLTRIPEEDDFFTRLKKGLSKTKAGFIGRIEKILSGSKTINEDVLDELEETLILSDIGVETTRRIIDDLREKYKKAELSDPEEVKNHIRSEIQMLLKNSSAALEIGSEKPRVIMVVGVNGVGKTTTIAKIAKRFKDLGKSVLLAAGDTFRAGAIQQLQEWGRRIDVEVIAQKEGSDPSAVAWDAVAAAKNRAADIVIIDTAGRLHTKYNLMEELRKVHRVIGKNIAGAPHEVLLVLDATTGQNAITQAKLFKEAVDVTGIVLTKLDGTAKGGIIISIMEALKIPVKLIGIGERMDDLRDFDSDQFTAALFEIQTNED